MPRISTTATGWSRAERLGEEAVLDRVPRAAGECEQRRPAAAVVQHDDG